MSMPESTTARSEGGGTSNESRQRSATPLRGRLKSARSELATVDEQTRSFVNEYPLLALGGALLGGYVLGRLVSRL